jgi:hypothetical protein
VHRDDRADIGGGERRIAEPLQLRDGAFCDGVAKFFRKRGDTEFADRFRADLEKALYVPSS